MKWKLERIDEVYREWKQDSHGYYTMVNQMCKDDERFLRVDIFNKFDMPQYSMFATAANVEYLRRAIIDWFLSNKISLTTEHAAYIGSELEQFANEIKNVMKGE